VAKAPADTTCTLYYGPGTTTPYAVRAAGVACRLVEDPYFRNVKSPLIDSWQYFTNDTIIPNAPSTTDAGAGLWHYNYAVADRVEFFSHPGILYLCGEVLACTGPAQAPYWRAEVIETEESPMTPCQLSYKSSYKINFSGPYPETWVYRAGPTYWIGGSVILQSESGAPPGGSCYSTWNVIGHGFYTASWNGFSNQIFGGTIPPYGTALVTAGP